jgi:hypothetical protein
VIVDVEAGGVDVEEQDKVSRCGRPIGEHVGDE